MNCPHCQKEIIITLTAPAEDIQLRWEEHAQELRDEWKQMERNLHNDDRNLDWLDGRKLMLNFIGVSKYEALRLLKKDDDV